MKVYVLMASSESSDHYGPFVVDRALSNKEQERFWREKVPQEFADDGDGPGAWGSYLYPDMFEAVVQSPPQKKAKSR